MSYHTSAITHSIMFLLPCIIGYIAVSISRHDELEEQEYSKTHIKLSTYLIYAIAFVLCLLLSIVIIICFQKFYLRYKTTIILQGIQDNKSILIEALILLLLPILPFLSFDENSGSDGGGLSIFYKYNLLASLAIITGRLLILNNKTIEKVYN